MEGGVMSGIVDALYRIKYNPFKYGEYLASFYSGAEDVENNLLLAPLVIPLCSHYFYANKLMKANKRSSIWSIFDDRTKLYDLQERVDEFNVLTEESIQYCLVNDLLIIENETLLLRPKEGLEATLTLQKNAVNLGKLFSGHSVFDIYAFLGVKPQ